MSGAGRLAHRVALVTGASRGIGAAVARAYAAEGARVVVSHLPTQTMAALAEQVADDARERGAEAIALPADVTDRTSVRQLVTRVNRTYGPVDVLVCNAASIPRTPWTEIRDAEWDHVVAVNLKGAFICAQEVHDGMQAAGYGKIITTSSITARTGLTPFLHYVSSKAGILGFTRALAREVGGDGIRVNCVMPGAIRTEQELEDFPDQDAVLDDLRRIQCLPVRGDPSDVVGAYVFLASAESDFVTGQVITVDGGWIHY